MLKLNCTLHISNCKVQNDLNHIMASGPYHKFEIYNLHFALAAAESRAIIVSRNSTASDPALFSFSPAPAFAPGQHGHPADHDLGKE
jgi:hypothetical protein